MSQSARRQSVLAGCCCVCYSLLGHALKRASDSPIAIATPLIVHTVTPYWPPLLGAGGNLGSLMSPCDICSPQSAVY